MPKNTMSSEQFRKLMRDWRVQHPHPQADYLKAIPKHVAESMALEGEHITLAFLEENLERA